jgi:hypothetical protein
MLTVCLIIIALSPGLSLFAQEGYTVGDHELFIMPTAEVLPRGTAYFADYELVLLNVTYGVTDTTSIGVFSIFPFASGALQTLTVGVKQQFVNNGEFKSAAWASYTPPLGLLTFGGVVSLENGNTGFHAAIGRIGSPEDSWGTILMAGFRRKLSGKLSIMVEYTNMAEAFEENFAGLITLGVRYHWKNIAIDFGGIRPLYDTDGWALFPVLKATFYIK